MSEPTRIQRHRKAVHRLEMRSGHRFDRTTGDTFQCRRCKQLFVGAVLGAALAISECGAAKATAT